MISQRKQSAAQCRPACKLISAFRCAREKERIKCKRFIRNTQKKNRKGVILFILSMSKVAQSPTRLMATFFFNSDTIKMCEISAAFLHAGWYI